MKYFSMNIRKSILVIASMAMVLGVFPLAASAHVHVDPETASQGGYQTFSFKVPNEKDDASTVKVEVKLPDNSPIQYVAVQPKPGWTYSLEKSKLDEPIKGEDGDITETVSKITWESGAIKPGEFDTFNVSIGPLPETDSIEFKTLQTYDSGEVVSWIDETPESGEEPEFPAPVVALQKASEEGDSHTSATETTMESKEDSDSQTIAYIGIGVGLVALVTAAVALIKKK